MIHNYSDTESICICFKFLINSSPSSTSYMRQWVSIGLDNGWSPDRQAIIWIHAVILLIGPLGTNFKEIRIKLRNFHSWKCIWKCRLVNGGNVVQGGISQSRLVKEAPADMPH